jgi:F-type H+-transporting ATPase subunit delta
MAMAVANRYARALADVVGRGDDYRAVLRELRDYATAYRQSADLREFLETPAVSLQEKTRVLGRILASLSASTTTSNFLRVLLVNYRMALLDQIIEAFRKIANARLGIVEVKIFSAEALAEFERKALSARFRELTGYQVELEFHQDSKLLGGIFAQIGSTVYDGSVRGQLERIGEQLAAP